MNSQIWGAGVSLKELPGKVRIEVDGQLFTEYHHAGAPHVYFYPLIGPGGLLMTRHYPMRQAEGEAKDHPHHRSLWYSHGDVNGVDFWSESPKAGKIVHKRFLEVTSREESGWFRSENQWVAPDGTVVCEDEWLFKVYRGGAGGGRLFDFEVTMKAGDKALVLGDTKEGSMAVRLAETMRLAPNEFNKDKPPGQIVMSTGVRGKETWGKRAAWCDYHGLVEGRRVGLAIFDHPGNPKHPTWWHVRDYGLFAANPFGVHDFEKKDKGAGDVTIAAGQRLTWRYRFYLHEGDEIQSGVARHYEAYAGTGKAGGQTNP